MNRGLALKVFKMCLRIDTLFIDGTHYFNGTLNIQSKQMYTAMHQIVSNIYLTFCCKKFFFKISEPTVQRRRNNFENFEKLLKLHSFPVMSKVHQMEMKIKEVEGTSSFTKILKMPHCLLVVCGLTMSTDGVTISRRMVIYSGAIYILNLILLFKNITCFDKEDNFESSDVAENLLAVIYQISLQILISILLYGGVKKFPPFLKKLKELEQKIKDDSLQGEIQSSTKRITIIGFVCSLTLAIGLIIFKFLFAVNTLENCPKHRWFFSTKNQYEHVMRFLNVGNIFPGFQGFAGLTFCVSLCNIVTIYFKYLRRQLEMMTEDQINRESGEKTVQEFRCITREISRIRLLYEHTRELTAKVDELLYLLVGVQLLFEIPMICLYTYNSFVPEFRSDLLFYSSFAFSFCLVILVVTANLNSQVKSHQTFFQKHSDSSRHFFPKTSNKQTFFQAQSMAEVLYKIDASSSEDSVRNQVCIRVFLKKIQRQSVTPVSIEPRPFGCNALLSELLRQVLLGISLNCLCITSILDLDHLQHGHMQILDLPSNACLNGLQRRASDPNG